MPRLSLKPSVVKRLFALSGNKCAYPNCPENLVNVKGMVIGEICHIEAAEKGGERFNEKSNDEYRRSFENLILMCGKHHKETNDIIEYTTPKLKKFKADHEKKFLKNTYKASDQIVQQAIENYMKQENKNSGSGTQINNQARTQNIGTQIGSQHNHYGSNDTKTLNIDGARKINYAFKHIIDSFSQKASPPSTEVIDFRNELAERIERNVEIRPTKDLRFRKDNGRIKADVESYEKEHGVIIDEESDEGQAILRQFLSSNDKEQNEKLKRLLVQKNQQRPAIITCDGFLINGNRRKMALEELYKEKNQDSKYETMRVVILPEGVTELDIQKIENRYQLQSEGKSEYQGLNRALTLQRNIDKGFPLEAQLRDDPNYHNLPDKEFTKVVDDYKRKFLNPLKCADRYLKTFEREGLYNTISESAGDKEGRWQAFVDYSNFYYSTLDNSAERLKLGIKEGEIGLIENAIFKIIRKRNLNSPEIEKALGKLHAFVRGGNLKKYLSNNDAKKLLINIAKEVKEDIPEEKKKSKDGERYTEREIDEKWSNDAKVKEGVLGNLMQAYKAVNSHTERNKPLELLEDALKKLKHDNLKIENMDAGHYDKAMDLTKQIAVEAEVIYGALDKARYELKKLTKKGKK